MQTACSASAPTSASCSSAASVVARGAQPRHAGAATCSAGSSARRATASAGRSAQPGKPDPQPQRACAREANDWNRRYGHAAATNRLCLTREGALGAIRRAFSFCAALAIGAGQRPGGRFTPSTQEPHSMAITPLMPVYPRSPVRPVRGEGVYLYGEQGEKYLDFAAGIAVNHPRPRPPASDQGDPGPGGDADACVEPLRVAPGRGFAQRLCDLTFADTVFFTNSGVEAVECAIKTARRYHYAKGNPAQARPDHLLERLSRPDDGDDQRDRPGQDDRRLRAAAAGLQGRRVQQSRRGARARSTRIPRASWSSRSRARAASARPRHEFSLGCARPATSAT